MPVREMKEDDLPLVLAIQRELAFQEWNERQFCAEIAADYALCVVYETDKILGYAIFHLMGPDSELLCIATSASVQHRGIGTALLQAGLTRLDFTNGDKMFLEVREGNTNARRFYEKNGFVAFANRKNYYADGENAVLYQKTKE